MKSHLLLLCLCCVPVVYCRDETVLRLSDLTSDTIKKLMSYDMTMNEWEAMLDQRINVEKEDYSVRVDVKRELSNHAKANAEVQLKELEEIQGIIFGAYHCTVLKYAALISFLQRKEIRQLNVDLVRAKNKASAAHGEKYGTPQLMAEFQNVGVKYPVDLYINSSAGEFLMATYGQYTRTGEKKIHSVWESLLGKNPEFEIQYDVYLDVMAAKFPNYKAGTIDGDLMEIDCVLNEIIRQIDSGIVEKCSSNNGSFTRCFGSLGREINGAYGQLLLELDALNEDQGGSKFYHDYSKPAHPEAAGKKVDENQDLNKIENIQASGCFLRKMNFKINHLEKKHVNTEDPTEVYGVQKRRVSRVLKVNAVDKNTLTMTEGSGTKKSSSTGKSTLKYIITVDKEVRENEMQLVVVEPQVDQKEAVTMEMVVSAPPPPAKNDIYTNQLMAEFGGLFSTDNLNTATNPDGLAFVATTNTQDLLTDTLNPLPATIGTQDPFTATNASHNPFTATTGTQDPLTPTIGTQDPFTATNASHNPFTATTGTQDPLTPTIGTQDPFADLIPTQYAPVASEPISPPPNSGDPNGLDIFL